jgi:hypothetical protein
MHRLNWTYPLAAHAGTTIAQLTTDAAIIQPSKQIATTTASGKRKRSVIHLLVTFCRQSVDDKI